MVNDEVTREQLQWCVRTTKESMELTEKIMTELMKLGASLKDTGNYVVEKVSGKDHGKMSVKQLIQKDEGATCVDISKTELRDFQKVAKRYGVDFAVVQHKKADPPMCTIFFKARDQDAITDVIRHYTEKKLMKAQKPSLSEKIKEMKEKLANVPKKVMNKAKEISR